MAEDKRQLTDEEQKDEMVGLLVDVRKRHVRFERGIVPKHTTVVLDEDVSIPPFGITVHKGSYHMRLPEGTTPDCLTEEHEYLWTIELNGQSAIALADMVTDHMQGKNPLDRYRVEGERTELKIDIDLRRVDLAEGRPLHFEELLAWIAIAEAERDGDKDRARRVFELVYKGSVEEIADRPVTIRVAEEFPQLIRAATKRKKTKGVTLKNRKGKEVTSITAIEDFLELKPSGRKTMVKLNQEATRLSQSGEYRHDGETVCRVVLDVKETARQYGITEASARKRLRRDFNAIAKENITVKRGKNWVTIPVAGDRFGIIGDKATFTLSPSFMQVLLNPNAPQVDLPPEIYGTDDTNYPAALQIGFKLYSHDNQNYGKPNQSRMKFTSLLHAATELPTPEEMARARRSKTNRIMGPFEATMDHLVSKGVLKDWDYCHENGEPLAPDEYEAIQTEHDLGKPTPWAMAQGLLVTWELGRRYAQNEEARQASRDRRRAQALEAKAEKEKEAKAKERRIRGKVETIIAKRRAESEAER